MGTVLNYEEILNTDLFGPLEKLVFEKSSDLVNVEALLNLINSARDDFPSVARNLIVSILICKRAYRKISDLHSSAELLYDKKRASLEATLLMKDETNPYYKKVNGPTTFAKAEAKADDGVMELRQRVEELAAAKNEVWDLKESLEEALDTCKIIFQNPERVRSSGEVVDVDSQLEELKEILDD